MNKKGFTLVELLAVIIVLSIIVLITAISTSNIIKNSKNNLSDVQIKSIERAAKTYYVEEGINLNESCINVSELISKGYIDQESIKNPNDNEEMLGSVKIRYINNKYIYKYQTDTCNVCKFTKGDGSKIGDEISCELDNSIEEFYVISNDGKNIEMLTRQNIHLTEYKQSEDAGTIAFATQYNYWVTDDTTYPMQIYGDYKEENGNYINNLFPVVENYVSYLKNKISNVTGNLVSYDHLKILDVRTNQFGALTPSWFDSTDYWLGFATGDYETSCVTSGRNMIGQADYCDAYPGGVRPVITIPTNEVEVLEPPKIICEAVTEKTKTIGNVPEGNFLPGDEYICEVAPKKEYTFFVLSTENNSVNLIMDRNICGDGTPTEEGKPCLVAWNNETGQSTNAYGPVTAMSYLHSATKSWVNIPSLNYAYNDKEFQGTTTANISYISFVSNDGVATITASDGTTTTTIGSKTEPLKARMPIYSGVWNSDHTEKIEKGELVDFNNNGYLYENLDGSYWEYDESTKPKNNISNIYGYWTLSSDSISNSYNYAWTVDYTGIIGDSGVSMDGTHPSSNGAGYGVRPVITLSKTNLK